MQIISRAQWGARHPDGFRDAPLPAQEVWLHHSVTLAPDIEWVDADGDGVEDDEERAMRDIEQIGQNNFGGGFSYTFAVMPSGRIYQGHSVHRQGAHTYGRNDKARAIVLVGNYETNEPTEAQNRAVAWLVRHGKDQGWWRNAVLNGGHRDVYATACPGNHAYAAIPDINRLAESGEPLDLEDDMAVSDQEKADLLAGARAVRFGKTGERQAGELAVAVDAIALKLNALTAKVDKISTGTGYTLQEIAAAVVAELKKEGN